MRKIAIALLLLAACHASAPSPDAGLVDSGSRPVTIDARAPLPPPPQTRAADGGARAAGRKFGSSSPNCLGDRVQVTDGTGISSTCVQSNGQSVYTISSTFTGVTWADDLSTSTNTAQWVSGLSGPHGTGGNITVGDGTHVVTFTGVGSSASSTPAISFTGSQGENANNYTGGSLTFSAGEGSNAAAGNNTGGPGGTATFNGGFGGNSTGTAANSNGGNLTLAAGSPGSGGSGAAGAYGSVQIAANGNQAFALNTATSSGFGIGASPGTDPTITRGTGVPATTQTNGSLFLRTDGTNGNTAIYAREGGIWYALGGAVTWANDLSTSTNTHQYVSSISGSNGTAGLVNLGDGVNGLELFGFTSQQPSPPTITIAGSFGYSAAATAGGAGGSVTYRSGQGGAGQGTNQPGGVGGQLTIFAGNGGASTGNADNANGGLTYITGGGPGTGGSGSAGSWGDIQFANATVKAFATDNAAGPGFGIGTTPGFDPTITRGTGVPATTQTNGSLFLRIDGTNDATALYAREAGAWWAIGSHAVTWADDLAGSTGTHQWVASISGASGTGGFVSVGDGVHGIAFTGTASAQTSPPQWTISASTGWNSNSGVGALLSINGGLGGSAAAGNNTAGNGGNVILSSGIGGTSTGTAANANSGNLQLTTGSQGFGGSGAAGTSGDVLIGPGNAIQAFSTANVAGPGFGIGASPGTDPTLTRGTGVPATTQTNGSLFLRTDGTNDATALYAREAGAWWAIGSHAVTWADDLAGSTNTAQYVAAISGNAGAGGAVNINATSLQFAANEFEPAYGQNPETTDTATSFLTIRGQDAWSGASTNVNGASIYINGGESKSHGVTGLRGQVQLGVGYGSFSPEVQVTEPVVGQRVLALATVGGAITSTQMPSGTGDGVIYIANAVTVPGQTGVPIGGGTLFENAGTLSHKGAGEALEEIASVGSGTQNSQRGAHRRRMAYLRSSSSSNSTVYTYAMPGTAGVPAAVMIEAHVVIRDLTITGDTSAGLAVCGYSYDGTTVRNLLNSVPYFSGSGGTAGCSVSGTNILVYVFTGNTDTIDSQATIDIYEN